jgi:hypothetical protein
LGAAAQAKASGQALTDWSQGFPPIDFSESWTNPTVNRQQLWDVIQGVLPLSEFAGPVAAAARETAGTPTSWLDVFHGSRHTFPPTEANPLGEFDPGKIGSGEGNQAYAHGIYVAENPNVAKSYVTAGEPDPAPLFSTLSDTENRVIPGWVRRGIAQKRMELYRYLDDFRGRHAEVSRELAAGQHHQPGLLQSQQWSLQGVIDSLEKLQDRGQYSMKSAGNLYHIDLPDEHIERMLDWDKPLSQQNDYVRQSLAKAGMWHEEAFQRWTAARGELDALTNKPPSMFSDAERARYFQLRQEIQAWSNIVAQKSTIPRLVNWQSATGEGLYRELSNPRGAAHEWSLGGQMDVLPGSPPSHTASAFLKAHGIPGVKYLDQSSRGASGTGRWRITYKDGSSQLYDFRPNDSALQQMGATAEQVGTRNFVLFDPSIARIIKREDFLTDMK